MNPEDLLTCLLAALRPALPAETALTLGAFTEEDWQQLLALADDHRVGPLLYQRLCLQGGWDQLPAVARQRLQQRYDAQAWHNLCLYHNLHTLLTAFQARQIPTILLKGAHLAATVYDQIALRPMMDIDLLVPFDALQEAIAAIQQLGYRPVQPIFLTDARPTFHHLPRFIKEGAAAVELHWTITKPNRSYSIDIGHWWQRATPQQVAGVATLGLAPEDLLLHICLHAAYHHFFHQGILFLCDIAKTVDHYHSTLDWSTVVERAAALGWTRGLYLALALAQRLLDAAIPASVLAALQPADFDPQLITLAQMSLQDERHLAKTIPHDFSQLWEMRSRSQQLRLFWQVCFPSRARMIQQYSVPPRRLLLYLYYPRRIASLLVRYSGMGWQRLLGNPTLVTLTRRKHTLAAWLESDSNCMPENK